MADLPAEVHPRNYAVFERRELCGVPYWGVICTREVPPRTKFCVVDFRGIEERRQDGPGKVDVCFFDERAQGTAELFPRTIAADGSPCGHAYIDEQWW